MKSFYTKDYLNFLNVKKVLNPHQYGLQKKKKLSTTCVFFDMVSTFYDCINISHYTGLLFLDLKKAFVSPCHKTLLSKLEHYGIRGLEIRFFLKRQQFVMLNGNFSKCFYSTTRLHARSLTFS